MATKSTGKTHRRAVGVAPHAPPTAKKRRKRSVHTQAVETISRDDLARATVGRLPDGTVVVRISPNKKSRKNPSLYSKGGKLISMRPATRKVLERLIPEGYFSHSRGIQQRSSTAGTASAEEQIDPMAEIDSPEELPARERDMSDVEAELHAALSPQEMVGRMGLTRAAISNQRNAGKILGLLKGNRYVFPSWQLDKSGQPHAVLKQLLDTLKIVSEDPTNLLIYMTTGLDFYEGKSIKDFLIAGDAESALSVARTIAKL